jgi:peptidoglycan/LPS O-acetylase OafA/YrhL
VAVSVRIAFLDNVRYLMILFVLVYHSVAAYATVVPWWFYHDTSFFAANITRELLDVFIMPVLFFVSGYFALPSLEKRTVSKFLVDKARRLLIPWVLAVLIIMPLLFYDTPNQTIKPFWNYWLTFMGGFPTQLSYLPHTLTQGPYWFISLLFAFFVVFAFVYAVTRGRWIEAMSSTGWKDASGRSVLVALALSGGLSFAGYFISLVFVPDTSWLTLGPFLEFQPTRLVFLVCYFALGVYAQLHQWFAAARSLGNIALWGAISVVLGVAYLMVGQPLFGDLAGLTGVSVGLLLPFALVRSFLILSVLILLVSIGARYWNRSNRIDQELSASSYNIYLTHVWFVVLIQGALLEWLGSSALKAVIVFVLTLAVSFAISRWVVGKHGRATTAVLIALFVFCLVVRP